MNLRLRSIVLNTLFGLTILSLMTASSRSPGRPDPSLTPETVRQAARQEQKDWEGDDDIPLGQLRRSQPAPLRLHEGRVEVAVEPSSSGSGSDYGPEVSPFPLNTSPFVPTTATDAGEDIDEEEDGSETSSRDVRDGRFEEEIVAGDTDDRARLLEGHYEGGEEPHAMRKSLFAKNSSGGVRWCKKCDGWKPDRCHHCRQCRRCTLKSESSPKRHRCIRLICSGPSLRLDRHMCRVLQLYVPAPSILRAVKQS
jgi:palmitoyltransferase